MLLNAWCIQKVHCLRSKYVLFRSSSQCVGIHEVTKVKAKCEVKSRWKTMRFASNQLATCFILHCNLMQIATWLASDDNVKWLKWRHQSHKKASHSRKKRVFISIWLSFEMLKTGKKVDNNSPLERWNIQGVVYVLMSCVNTKPQKRKNSVNHEVSYVIIWYYFNGFPYRCFWLWKVCETIRCVLRFFSLSLHKIYMHSANLGCFSGLCLPVFCMVWSRGTFRKAFHVKRAKGIKRRKRWSIS